MSRILIATDAFPPACGGSGWSTWELARGLRARGHDLVIVQPKPGRRGDGEAGFDGFAVRQIGAAAPRLPFVRNYFKNERLWDHLASRLAQAAADTHADLIHAQHVLTAPAAVRAGRAARIPVVCTVRDYWPVCYWGTLIHDPSSPTLCPACTRTGMATCLKSRAGIAWPAALPMIPYMRANLARKQGALAGASAVVAVSRAIAGDLRARAAGLGGTRIEVIPNPVDVDGLDEAAAKTAPPLPGDYAVFIGKLEINKGTAHLLPAIARADLPWPVLVVGDGAERGRLERAARALRQDVRFTGWLPREKAVALLAHASLLVFPSYGPESLSRVLLEAAALRVPIAAMETGGTGDIVTHGETGLLAASADDLGDAMARLAGDRALATDLAAAARRHVEAAFATPRVAARVDALYAELIARERISRG